MRSLCSALGLAALVAGTSEQNSQLAKVIKLLQDMMAEGTSVMNKEQVLYAEQKQFCTDELQRLEREISDDKDEKSKAEGEIADAKADQASLSELISELEADVAAATSRKKDIKATREEENAEFVKESMDLEESVSALVRASAIIERQHSKNKKITQAEFFLQTSASKDLPPRALDLLAMKVSQTPAAYESKSGGVLELLDGLEEDFKKKLHQCKMDELHRKQNWELETQRLVDLIEKAENDISDRSTSLQERKADEGKASEMLAAVTAELAADSKEHRGTGTSCSQKAKSFADKQQLRKEELEAQQQAIDVLQQVPGGAAPGTSFLQLPSGNVENAQVGLWIRKQGAKINSRMLVQLADKIAEDPFAKVKLMIKEMISKVQKDMQEAVETKGFCELGFKKNDKKTEKLNAAFNKFTALIEKSAGESKSLKEDVKELSAKAKATREAMSKASTERSEEKELNEKKIKDATDAQTAVAHAVQVLQDFYAKASGATAFIQTKNIKIGSADWNALNNAEAAVGYDPREYHAAGEDTFGETYKGQQGKGEVIIGILEVVLSDFAREQSETEAAEAASVAAFEKFMQQGKVSTTKMDTTISLKTADAKAADATLAGAKTDLKNTNKQIAAVQEERAALVPMCPPEHGGTKGVVTFEERTAQRQEEIESLKGALQMLAPRDSA